MAKCFLIQFTHEYTTPEAVCVKLKENINTTALCVMLEEGYKSEPAEPEYVPDEHKLHIEAPVTTARGTYS